MENTGLIIKQIAAEKNISNIRLSEATGIPSGTLSRHLNGKSKISLRDLVKYEKVLNQSLRDNTNKQSSYVKQMENLEQVQQIESPCEKQIKFLQDQINVKDKQIAELQTQVNILMGKFLASNEALGNAA